jgi:UDP-N-acetylmuramoyl-L-alanyl-D-glutamate--2,6-diaminopimelate ligase
MTLGDILYKVNVVAVQGSTAISIDALSIDSRLPMPNGCFIAIKGTNNDANDFINQAIENGAVAIISDVELSNSNKEIVIVQVKDAAEAAGIIAHNFYGSASSKLKLVGVTGTNGKTTVATLLFDLFSKLGYTCGLIGTVENKIGNVVVPSTHTTPDAIALNALLAKMKDASCDFVFVECSSHAIHQKRLAGLNFAVAIFTNISHDHLDYHNSFDEYIKVKKSWFDTLPSSAIVISNADDKRGTVMLQNTAAKKYYYSLKTIAAFKGKVLENSLQGLHMTINEQEVFFKMIGEFNAYNLLAVYATAILLGQETATVLTIMSMLEGAEGRFDYIVSEREKVVGIVDYAHTPDALLNVLATINKLRQGNEKLITVVGCGGNRDKAKRALMGGAACEHSDKVIFTSDNPRYENASEIIKAMEEGVSITARKKYVNIEDRREAIKTAVNFSAKNDIILIAGKGHEKYQEINGEKKPFDDKEILNEMFQLLEK